MSDQIPTKCRTVLYRLTENDAQQINRRRTTGDSIAIRLATLVQRMTPGGESAYAWPRGAQAHIGSPVKAGDSFPMIIVVVWGTAPDSKVNGQVFLDGTDVLWVQSVSVGIEPGSYQWPART